MERVESLRTENKLKKTEIGEIPVDWEVKALKEVLSLNYGDGLPEGKRKGDKYPVFGSNGIIGYHDSFLVKGPGIIIGRKGTIGSITWSTEDYWPIDTTYYVVPYIGEIDLKWLYYILKILKLYQLNAATGTPGLNRNVALNIKIPLPPLSEQKKVAEILVSVDEAIDKKQEIIEKTKMLKKGLMQELFTRGIGHKKFKETEIGEIAAGWEISSVKNHTALITKGTTPTTYGYSYTKEGVLFLRVENIGEQGKFFLKDVKYISEETNRFLNRSILQSGDILISIAGALGRVSVIPDKLLPANINQALAIIRLKDNSLDRKFLRYVLTSQMTLIQVNFMAAQLAQANLNLKQVGDLKFPLPNLNEQRKIAEILTSVDEEIENEMAHKERLEGIKKGLLQVLLTGKIRAKI